MKLNERLCSPHQWKRNNHNSENFGENTLQTELSCPVERERAVFLVFLIRNSESVVWLLMGYLTLKFQLSESLREAERLLALHKHRVLLMPLWLKSVWLLEALVQRLSDFSGLQHEGAIPANTERFFWLLCPQEESRRLLAI